MRDDPIILLGMHRSGTSLLAEVFERIGVFMGCDLPYHHEPLFFVDANDWIFRRAHGAWDEPTPVRRLLDRPEARRAIEAELARKVRSHTFARRYVGLRRLWRFHRAPEFHWGWKDPRTTVAYPLWHAVFPRAKYIFMMRNGVDVAASLRARERARLGAMAERLIGEGPARIASLRCLDLHEAFALWEESNQLCLENQERAGGAPLHSLRYEDFLAAPAEELRRLCDALDLRAADTAIAAACQGIRRERAWAFRGDAELEALHARIKGSPLMKRFGYDS